MTRAALLLLGALLSYGLIWLWTEPEPHAIVDLY